MANKKPKFDANAAFKSIVSKPIDVDDEEVIDVPASTITSTPITAQTNTTTPIITTTVNDKPIQEKIPKTFYITKKHIRAITLKALDDNKDNSAIVRDALDKYLSDYL